MFYYCDIVPAYVISGVVAKKYGGGARSSNSVMDSCIFPTEEIVLLSAPDLVFLKVNFRTRKNFPTGLNLVRGTVVSPVPWL